ncbi:KTSC domain-containing protein [Candidatus Sororendozoicomonas aggregata]|uniref:KTSC domain-containing protein n=1 Tax=Candidatus Sororendozoicomonas aggregata TaxID=3073239 RepID=UPI002ED40B1E
MDRQSVASSNIRSIGYDSGTLTLEVAFTSGGIYQYFNVPESQYQRLMAAYSKGTCFADHIKNRYRFRKVG